MVRSVAVHGGPRRLFGAMPPPGGFSSLGADPGLWGRLEDSGRVVRKCRGGAAPWTASPLQSLPRTSPNLPSGLGWLVSLSSVGRLLPPVAGTLVGKAHTGGLPALESLEAAPGLAWLVGGRASEAPPPVRGVSLAAVWGSLSASLQEEVGSAGSPLPARHRGVHPRERTERAIRRVALLGWGFLARNGLAEKL